jgi:glutathione S-transferase
VPARDTPPAASDGSDAPLIVYGTDCSYYTGKLEAYLRAKGVAYRLEPFSDSNLRRCASHTGVMQIPQVECPDGTWLVDTTLIIEHFETRQPEPALRPTVPAVAFVSLLLEDYADEWLWRPAMHYRWSFPETARLMSAWLAEHLAERRVPKWLKRQFWLRRQYGTFVKGDGVSPETRGVVEASYLGTLEALEGIFRSRPYVLGERPTEADFGFFASMFRHFCSDPTPGRVMRERAPAVHEWVARMWNGRPERFANAPLPSALPGDLAPLLDAVRSAYLPYLDANARAYADGSARVRYQVQGVTFDEPVKPYRVWCRDRLRRRLVDLDARDLAELERELGRATLAGLAAPSPKAAEEPVGALPIEPTGRRKPVDSWWRAS